MDELKPHVITTGAMQNNIARPYDFSISEVFKEAWQRVSGSKKTFWGAVGYIVILNGFLAFIIWLLQTTLYFDKNSLPIQLISDIGIAIIDVPMVGAWLLGVRRAVNLPIKANSIFQAFHYFWRIIGMIVLLNLAFMLIFTIGIFLDVFLLHFMRDPFDLIIIGILGSIVVLFFSSAFMFAPVLIMEKNLGIFAALKASLYAFNQHWLKIIVMNMLMFIVFSISALPLFIGIIWSVPWSFILYGVLYRTIFGVNLNTK